MGRVAHHPLLQSLHSAKPNETVFLCLLRANQFISPKVGKLSKLATLQDPLILACVSSGEVSAGMQ